MLLGFPAQSSAVTVGSGTVARVLGRVCTVTRDGRTHGV